MEVQYIMDMREKDIIAKINQLKKEVNDPEAEYAPLEAQEKLDEITELEYMLKQVRKEKVKVTPVLNAPTVAERPKGRKYNRMGDARVII